MEKSLHFEPLYPDVLGAIAGNLRVTIEPVQLAVGIFPPRAYLNQPIEVVAILQNTVDQAVEVKVTLEMPSRDAAGKPIAFSIPKKSVTLHMTPGEAGVVRLPVVPITPTQPGEDIPVTLNFKARVARTGTPVRPPTRGAPPSVLAVSPFKLQVLQDIEFGDHAVNGENISVFFDIEPKRLPAYTQALKPTYEPLWTRQQLGEERQHMLAQIDAARLIAHSFTTNDVFAPLFRMVDELYAAQGLPLHPGETRAIAKMLTHTLDDHSDTDPNYRVEDTRWFQTLCQTLASDETIARREPGEIVVRHLFEALVYDAILLAFGLIRPRVRVNLGDKTERIHYANQVLKWLAGQSEPDLIYIYLPLVLGGVAINHVVAPAQDDPWQMLDELREAYRGRVRLVSGDVVEIFDMLDRLLERGEEDLRRARIQRT